jgi:hypothetical protein
MQTTEQRAIALAYEYHRIINTKKSSFCSCGEPDTEWPTDKPQYWIGWGEHFSTVIQRLANKIDGK